MKINPFPGKLTKTTLSLALIVASICVLAVYLWNGVIHEDFRESLTIEEAQSLVEFQLCKTTYVPSGIDPTPKILYDAEDVNIPELTYIRLQYRRVNDQEKIFEIYQRYTPDAGMRTTYPEMAHEGAKVILLDWISYPKFLSEAEMEVAMTRTQMASSVFQTNGTVWWLYEITDPSEYRSTMTKWIKDHVEYRILSYLPAEEIEKVTLSMLECSNP